MKRTPAASAIALLAALALATPASATDTPPPAPTPVGGCSAMPSGFFLVSTIGAPPEVTDGRDKNVDGFICAKFVNGQGNFGGGAVIVDNNSNSKNGDMTPLLPG